MKTLFLIDAQGGGAMTHVLELAEGLSKEKFFPEILFFTNGPAIEHAKRKGISTHVIEKDETGYYTGEEWMLEPGELDKQIKQDEMGDPYIPVDVKFF